MTVFSELAKFLGLTEAIDGYENHSQPLGTNHTGSTASSPTNGTAPIGLYDPYAALWRSVDNHLSKFMAECVLTHRIYEPSDIFHIVRMQVVGTTAESQAVLQRFLDEFRPDSRRRATLLAIQRTCSQGVSSTRFVDFNRDFEQVDLQETDAYAAQLSEAKHDGYEITLHGEWELQQAVPSAAATVPTPSALSGLPIDLEIHDAKGTRNLRITEFPFVLGRRASMPQHAIEGTFVSRRHGMLERDAQQRVWFSDTSVNGSTLDGVHTLAGDRHPLRNGAVIVLGGDGAGRSECPEITVRWTSADEDENTPLRKPILQADDGMSTPLRTPLHSQSGSSVATPLTARSTSATSSALCLLAVQDAHGSHTVAVTRLPFVIGRDDGADCRLPEANEGVSRTHLVIQAIDTSGARIYNSAIGKWGTEVSGVEQPQEFALAWGKQITLAGRYTKTQSVTLQLLTPAQ